MKNTVNTYATRSAAYAAAAAFVGVELETDRAASARAGYPVMMDATGDNWISDLGCRYEANRADGMTVNFWVDDTPETRVEQAETARETAAPEVYETYRDLLRAGDLSALQARRPEAVAELMTAAVHRAIDRREAETGRDGRELRARYARLNVTLSQTMDADAIGEAVAVALEMSAPGGWIDGDPVQMTDRETGDPVAVARRDLPLAYFAAIAAGRGLDRVMYADGGHAVKMTAREARENYDRAARKAAATRAQLEAAGEVVPEHVARLADMNDAREAAAVLEAEAADRPDDKETRAALRAARAAYRAASAAVAAGMDATETRRTVDPVAPSPEAAAIMAEQVAEILAEVGAAYAAAALAIAREVYRGAMTADGLANVKEAARLAGIPERRAQRAWKAVKAAAATYSAQERASAAIERAIDSDRRTIAARAARRASAAVKAEADRLAAETVAPTGAVRFTAGRPDRLARTAKMTPEALRDLAALARALFMEAATR